MQNLLDERVIHEGHEGRGRLDHIIVLNEGIGVVFVWFPRHVQNLLWVFESDQRGGDVGRRREEMS